MTKTSRQNIKDLIPSAIFNRLRMLFHRYGYCGDYANWDDTIKNCEGYDSPVILEKVCEASLRVKQGEAAYERDSVLFDEIQYSRPLLAGLLRIADNNHLHVLDFGGALGSTYYQNKSFLSKFTELHWCIVEQKNFVDCGKKYFEDEKLRFYYDLPSCMEEEDIDVAILSSVLPYLERPYELLDEIISYGIRCIIIDRTAFLNSGDKDRLTVQKVHPEIYPASYPAWFFNRNKFLDCFLGRYSLAEEFDALAGEITIKKPEAKAQDKGFIFIIKK